MVKLLMGPIFDVFIDSSGMHSSAPKSTGFVEALWRRREGVPDASLDPSPATAVGQARASNTLRAESGRPSHLVVSMSEGHGTRRVARARGGYVGGGIIAAIRARSVSILSTTESRSIISSSE